MMICKKKQIQSRKLPDNYPNYQKINLKADALLSRNNVEVHKQRLLAQKSYEIDPWYIKSHSKFDEMNLKIESDNKISKQNKTGKTFSSRKGGHKSSITTDLRKLEINVTQYSRKSPSHFTNQEINSPVKMNMLECSFRFQEYELQKAQQLKSVFMEHLQKNNHEHTKSKKQTKNNFIKRNKRNAFQIQFQAYEDQTKNGNHLTIQETKSQLILNKEKLQLESKELFRVILMKDQKNSKKPRPKSEMQNYRKIPIDSVWNMSYIEKPQLNPEFKLNRKSYSTISSWNKILRRKVNKSEEANFDLITQRSEVKVGRKNVIVIQNPRFKQKNSKEKITSGISQPRSLSKKFLRAWKIKNKSTLIIPSQVEKIYPNDKSELNNSHFHNRIHSSTYKSRQGNHVLRKFSKDDCRDSIQHDKFTEFENTAIQALFGTSHNKNPHKNRMKSRSLSNRQQDRNKYKKVKDRRIKPHEGQKRFIPKNFCIEGSTCEISPLFLELT